MKQPENIEDKLRFANELYERAKATDKYLATSNEIAIPNESHFSRADAGSIQTQPMRVTFNGSTQKPLNSNIYRDRVAACREAYENVGIIGNIIDIMTDFSIEDFMIVHEVEAIQNFYNNWAKTVRLMSVAEEIFKCIYRDGNVPVLAFNGKINDDEATQMKRAIAEQYSEAALLNLRAKSPNIIPIAYTILDVLSLDKEGSDIVGNTQYFYQIPADEVSAFTRRPNVDINDLKRQFGKDVETGRINIDPNRLSFLYYKKDSHKKWANPMLWRIIDDVKYKQLLRNMDISAAEGVINAFTIVKLGDTLNSLPASPEKFERLSALLKNPSKSKTLLWDDLIKLETSFPPVEKILGKEKYEQVNDDIRSGLGISEILVNGEGGNFANSYLSVKTLLERLETGRIMVVQWIQNEVNKIAKNMGFRNAPLVKMESMSLQDEEKQMQIALELADRNIISYRTVAEKFGANLDMEISRMKSEDKIRKQVYDQSPFTLLKAGKYGPIYQDGPFNFADTSVPTVSISPKKGLPTAQEVPGQEGGKLGGRPKGSTQKQKGMQTPRAPKGQSKAEVFLSDDLFAIGSEKFDKIYDIICDTLKSPDNPELTESDNEVIYDTIASCLARLGDEDIDIDNIHKALEAEYDQATAPAKLEHCVKNVIKQRREKFVEKHGHSPSKQEMKEITSSAWAICQSSLKKAGEI